MPDLYRSSLERCMRRFEDLAARYQPVTAVVIQIMRDPAPRVPEHVSGVSGPAGPHLAYSWRAFKGPPRHLHLFGHDQAVRDPLLAAAGEAWRAIASPDIEAEMGLEPGSGYPAADFDGDLWVHFLFRLLWGSRLPGRPTLGRYIKVDVDGTTWNVPLNDRYEPERGPNDDEHYRRAVQLTPRPANWFHSQINDLAGVSAAAMEMLRELDREAQAARAPIAAATTGAKRTGARGTKRRRTAVVQPLTQLQQQAVELYGKHNGSVKAIAAEMKIKHSTVNQHLNAAWRKLPYLKPNKTAPVNRSRGLPVDRRGQPTV